MNHASGCLLIQDTQTKILSKRKVGDPGAASQEEGIFVGELLQSYFACSPVLVNGLNPGVMS